MLAAARHSIIEILEVVAGAVQTPSPAEILRSPVAAPVLTAPKYLAGPRFLRSPRDAQRAGSPTPADAQCLCFAHVHFDVHSSGGQSRAGAAAAAFDGAAGAGRASRAHVLRAEGECVHYVPDLRCSNGRGPPAERSRRLRPPSAQSYSII